MGSMSEVDGDILRHMTNDELMNVIQLYKSKGDRYHCMSIYNDCRWARLLEKVDGYDDSKWKPLKKVYFTHRHGNLAKNGTYVSLQWDEMLTVQFHTLEESLQELKECIAETKLIDWKKSVLLSAIHTDCADEIVKIIKTLGGIVDYEIPCTCLVLAHSAAVQIQIPSVPEGYELRPLHKKHVDFIHANWPHNKEASVDFIRGMLEFNITLGIFRLKDDELIGWIFQNEFYGLGLLQVVPEEQGKGFAKLLTQAMSKKIAMWDNNDITSFTVVDNVKSKRILTTVGYKEICLTKWVRFKEIC